MSARGGERPTESDTNPAGRSRWRRLLRGDTFWIVLIFCAMQLENWALQANPLHLSHTARYVWGSLYLAASDVALALWVLRWSRRHLPRTPAWARWLAAGGVLAVAAFFAWDALGPLFFDEATHASPFYLALEPALTVAFFVAMGLSFAGYLGLMLAEHLREEWRHPLPPESY